MCIQYLALGVHQNQILTSKLTIKCPNQVRRLRDLCNGECGNYLVWWQPYIVFIPGVAGVPLGPSITPCHVISCISCHSSIKSHPKSFIKHRQISVATTSPPSPSGQCYNHSGVLSQIFCHPKSPSHPVPRASHHDMRCIDLHRHACFCSTNIAMKIVDIRLILWSLVKQQNSAPHKKESSLVVGPRDAIHLRARVWSYFGMRCWQRQFWFHHGIGSTTAWIPLQIMYLLPKMASQWLQISMLYGQVQSTWLY